MKVTSKCKLIEVELERVGTKVTLEILRMPKWLRGQYAHSPMHRAMGLELYSNASPALDGARVFIGGTLWEDDGHPGVKLFELEDNVIAYLSRVRILIECFDSEKLREDSLAFMIDQEKEWLVEIDEEGDGEKAVVYLSRKKSGFWQQVAEIRLNTTVKVERKGE